MESEVRKLIEEKDKKIEELQAKIRELEKKLKFYEIREVYQGIIPDEVLQKIVELPPDAMVLEIGKYLKQASFKTERVAETRAVETTPKVEVKEKPVVEEQKVESGVKLKEGVAKARVGVDLAFTQRYDFQGSDVAMLGEDVMHSIRASEGDYIVVQKEGAVNLRVLPYSKPGFIIIPSWVREKIGAKVNDFVEVSKK
ncbi:MAG: hypothetical protein ACK401_05115 [Archaeoglobaceae archaeon]